MDESCYKNVQRTMKKKNMAKSNKYGPWSTE